MRDKQLGSNMTTFFKESDGLQAVKGEGSYLIDEKHHRYLDTCNNVAAVGHSHPTVVHRGQQALAQIQTNGRFLNEVQQRYLGKLLKMFPPELNTVYLVNSGSEANDLAISIARAHSKARRPDDVMILDVAYHGHTSCLMDVSPYKWLQATDGKNYHKSHVHVLSIPDAYRGRYRGMTPECGSLYAAEAESIVEKTGGVGTFIAESAMGCGGVIMHPPTYLQKVYAAVQGAGGVCIADEVQTGFGKCGEHFWMFQHHGVVPDIVTMGKPMGNGYPIAAVVCKRALADSFASSGIEYFNTYGGNAVACTIGEAVLDTIIDEKLQENARVVGQHIKSKLVDLQKEFKCIGDVRGIGLFMGIEFVKDNKSVDIVPNGELTKFLVNHMKVASKVISARDGKDKNVIKIKPPLVFSKKDADLLTDAIRAGIIASIKEGI